jgi:hypothetical protein
MTRVRTVSQRQAALARAWDALGGADHRVRLGSVGIGWRKAHAADSGRLLVANGLLGLTWPFASMHQRQVLAARAATLADTAHLVLATVGSLLMIAPMAFAAAAFGMRFRLYSIATIVILLAFGVMTSLDAPMPWCARAAILTCSADLAVAGDPA